MQDEARKIFGEKCAMFRNALNVLTQEPRPAEEWTMSHDNLIRKHYLLVIGLGDTADWFCQLTYLNVVVNNSPSKVTGKCPF